MMVNGRNVTVIDGDHRYTRIITVECRPGDLVRIEWWDETEKIMRYELVQVQKPEWMP